MDRKRLNVILSNMNALSSKVTTLLGTQLNYGPRYCACVDSRYIPHEGNFICTKCNSFHPVMHNSNKDERRGLFFDNMMEEYTDLLLEKAALSKNADPIRHYCIDSLLKKSYKTLKKEYISDK